MKTAISAIFKKTPKKQTNKNKNKNKQNKTKKNT